MKRLHLASAILLLALGTACDNHGHGHDHKGGHERGGDQHEHGHDDHGHEGHHADHDLHDHPPDEHEHEHDSHAVGFTRWGEHFEMLTEYSRPVAGKPIGFLAHLTQRSDYTALSSGKVELKVEGNGPRAELSMLEAGKFRGELPSLPAGKHLVTFSVSASDVTEDFTKIEVTVYATEAEAKKAAQAGGDEKRGAVIDFIKEKQWQIPFGVARAESGQVVPSVEVAGEITTPPGAQADVGAAISGRLIPAPAGFPHPGQEVKKGDLLATIAAAPAAPEDGARAELAVVEARSRLDAAEKRVARAERLISDGATSEKELEDAKREARVAKDAVGAAEKARSVFSGAQSGQGAGTYRVVAPISGIVVDVQATSGKSVSPGDPLFRIVDMNQLWVRARVPEQSAARLQSKEDASFLLPGLDAWLPLQVTGAKPTARVINVGRTVDPRSRTVDLVYGLKDPDERIRVGAMVRVAVPVGTPWKGTVIPREGLIETEGRTIIFVQLEGELFEERPVRVAERSGPWVGISQGLRPGEHVVTKGANVIRLSARATTGASHGHVH